MTKVKIITPCATVEFETPDNNVAAIKRAIDIAVTNGAQFWLAGPGDDHTYIGPEALRRAVVRFNK